MALFVVSTGAGSGATRVVFQVKNRAAWTNWAEPMIHNPLIPGWFDVLWIGAAVVYVVLVIIAVALVWRRRETLDTPRTLIWCLVAIAVPVVFLVVWFIAGPKPEDAADDGSA